MHKQHKRKNPLQRNKNYNFDKYSVSVLTYPGAQAVHAEMDVLPLIGLYVPCGH